MPARTYPPASIRPHVVPPAPQKKSTAMKRGFSSISPSLCQRLCGRCTGRSREGRTSWRKSRENLLLEIISSTFPRQFDYNISSDQSKKAGSYECTPAPSPSELADLSPGKAKGRSIASGRNLTVTRRLDREREARPASLTLNNGLAEQKRV